MQSDSDGMNMPYNDDEVQLSTSLAVVWFMWAGFCLLIQLAMLEYVRTNRVGPRWFWASDACPDPEHFCGMIPAVTLLAAFTAVIMVTVGTMAIRAYARRGEKDAE